MVVPSYSIVWTRNAQLQLHNYYIYILRDSEQNASKVIREIVESLEKARNNPKFYPPDKYKANNDGAYRSFEKHRCRISYKIAGDKIVVIRARHVRQKPRQY